MTRITSNVNPANNINEVCPDQNFLSAIRKCLAYIQMVWSQFLENWLLDRPFLVCYVQEDNRLNSNKH